jgi:hypothetical protein
VEYINSIIGIEAEVVVDEEGHPGVALVVPAREVDDRTKGSLPAPPEGREGMEWSLTIRHDVNVNAVAVAVGIGTGEESGAGIGMTDAAVEIGMREMNGGDLGRGAQTIGIGIARGRIGIGGGIVNENEIIEIDDDPTSKELYMGQRRVRNNTKGCHLAYVQVAYQLWTQS